MWRGLGLASWMWCAACAPPAIGSDAANASETWSPPAPAEGHLRVATFNIRNYPTLPPSDDAAPRPEPLSYQLETDDEALLDVLSRLQFDVLAVQEIVDTERFAALLEQLSERTGRAYASAFSTNEHSGNAQHVGVVVAADAATIAWTREHPEVDPKGTLRSGLSARIESTLDGGATFGLMSLHLASGDSGKRAELRAEQAAQVAGIVAAQRLETGDGDYVVAGDLNTAREADELPALDAAFGSELGRQPIDASCTSYWIKKSSNPLLRPSHLDHVYLASSGEGAAPVEVAVGAHCAVQQCQPYESTSPDTGGSFWGVSDHCPLYFEIADQDDDAVAD